MERIIVDVREPLEFRFGHVKGAINISPSEMMGGIPDKLADVPKDTEIILYCMSGARSNTAIQILEKHGFTNLVNGVNKAQVQAKYL